MNVPRVERGERPLERRKEGVVRLEKLGVPETCTRRPKDLSKTDEGTPKRIPVEPTFRQQRVLNKRYKDRIVDSA